MGDPADESVALVECDGVGVLRCFGVVGGDDDGGEGVAERSTEVTFVFWSAPVSHEEV